jgi:hypothetical protein
MSSIDFDFLISLVGDQYGKVNMVCPECSATRSSPSKRKLKVFCVWRDGPDFLTYHCCRCGLKGYSHRRGAHAEIDSAKIARLKTEAMARDADHSAQQQRKAKWMWATSRPVQATPAETYMRSRGIVGDLPATLRFLPPHRPGHHPAMIAAFGMAEETEPGRLSIADDAVLGVHLTLLEPDGSSKADSNPNKIMVGSSVGAPICLAPPNDLLGLAIAEGIEDALSVHEASGLGAWAAGSASRLPALAPAIPSYIDFVRIVADADAVGREGARSLAGRVRDRGLHVEIIEIRGLRNDAPQLRIAA